MFFLRSDMDELFSMCAPSLSLLAGKRVLVTGAGGFLGRYFFELFDRYNISTKGQRIEAVGIDNFCIYGKPSYDVEYSDGLTMINGDVLRDGTFKSLGNFSHIIYLAGIASPYYYRKMPLETIDVSTRALRQALELARHSDSRLTFFSSSEIYGNPDTESIPTMESYNGNVSTMAARSCYDEGKRLGETLCYVYSEEYNVHTNVIRPFNVYGPGMGQFDYRVFPNFASQIKSGKNLKIYGAGRQTRTFCYVTDAVNGFLRVITGGKRSVAYNIGNPDPEISMANVAKLMISLSDRSDIGVDFSAYPESYPADEPQRRCPDISRAMKDLGYSPVVGLEEGLKRFLTWTSQTYLAQ